MKLRNDPRAPHLRKKKKPHISFGIDVHSCGCKSF